MKALTIQQASNTKTGKFSKTVLLNRIAKGEIRVFENNSNHNSEYNEVSADEFLRLKSGLRCNAKYTINKTETLKMYLGTSFNYKFSI